MIGAAFKLLELGRFATFPLMRDLLLALFELRQLRAQFAFERLRLFDAAMQFAEKARHVAFAVAHRTARAQHDVFRHARGA